MSKPDKHDPLRMAGLMLIRSAQPEEWRRHTWCCTSSVMPKGLFRAAIMFWFCAQTNGRNALCRRFHMMPQIAKVEDISTGYDALVRRGLRCLPPPPLHHRGSRATKK